jgi:hypothetical protein
LLGPEQEADRRKISLGGLPLRQAMDKDRQNPSRQTEQKEWVKEGKTHHGSNPNQEYLKVLVANEGKKSISKRC